VIYSKNIRILILQVLTNTELFSVTIYDQLNMIILKVFSAKE